jgi:predicted nuclease of predicted toxin-antitoxin system
VTSFLLDANLSPESARYLAVAFGLDVTDLISQGLGHLRDQEVVELAKREDRVIITFDLDIGEIYHRRNRGRFGVILLRLDDQTVEAVNRVLDRFFRSEAATIALERSLVVIDDRRVRVVTRS